MCTVTAAAPDRPRVEHVEKLEVLARRHWWVLVVLAITVVGTVARGAEAHEEAPGAWAGVLGAVAVLALLVRFRRPEVTVLVNAAAVATYFAVGFPDGPVYLSVLLSLYALTSRRALRDWLPYAATALVVVTAALLVRGVGADTGIGALSARTAWFLAVGSAAAAIGSAVRNRRQAQQELTRRAASEEQLRVAQDLHDGVGHGLAVIAMQAGVALHVLDKDPVKARQSLEAIRDTSRESLDALRAELTRLAPSTAATPLSPRNGLAELPVLLDRVRAGGLDVSMEGSAGPVPPEVDAVGYLVVQEALTNVLKHAAARRARVAVAGTDDVLEIVITDDGHGAAPSGAGLGIPGMRSRVEALGGTLETGSLVGDGFRVHAVVPIDEERRE